MNVSLGRGAGVASNVNCFAIFGDPPRVMCDQYCDVVGSSLEYQDRVLIVSSSSSFS